MPPDFVFLHARVPLETRRAWETLYDFKEFTYPEQGFLSHYNGKTIPRKGMPYTTALEANNTMKRLAIGMVMMLKPTLHPLNNILFQFQRMADYLYTDHYFHTRYYIESCRELMEFVYRFLRKLGFSFDVSYNFGRIPATIFQLAEGFRFRLEDIFGMTTKEKLLADPRGELKRMHKLYLERETYQGDNTAGDRFDMVFKILILALLIPKIKKAFKFALVDSDFKKFQLDEIETHWSNRRIDYHFGGVPYGIRQLKQGFKIYGL